MPNYSQPTSPRLGDAYDSKDSITGKIDKTVAELEAKRVDTYSSLATAAGVSTAGYIFYAVAEGDFYGVKKQGDSTVAAALT